MTFPALQHAQKPYIIMGHKRYVRTGCKTEQLFISGGFIYMPPADINVLHMGLRITASSRAWVSGGCFGYTPIVSVISEALVKASLAPSKTHFACDA